MKEIAMKLLEALSERGSLARITDDAARNAFRNGNLPLRDAYQDAAGARFFARTIVAHIAYPQTNPDGSLRTIHFEREGAYQLLKKLNLGSSFSSREFQAVDIYPKDFIHVAIAVTQFAFNQFLKARALDIADGRNEILVAIDDVDVVGSDGIIEIHNIEDIDAVISGVMNIADNEDFHNITISALGDDRGSVNIYHTSLSRSTVEKVLDCQEETLENRRGVLEIAADMGVDKLRASLIVFAAEHSHMFEEEMK